MLGFLVHRRQEDDRDAFGLLALADDLGGFVAVHAGHVDVEQDDRELALEEVPERLLAGTRGNNVANILKDALHGEQIALVVIHEKDTRTLGSQRRFRRLSIPNRLHRQISGLNAHSYSAASIRMGVASAAACSRERATQTRSSASSSSISTGFAM